MPIMARIEFTQNIQAHVSCPPREVGGKTVREVLDNVFADNEPARGYVLDEHGAVRGHMIVFVDGVPIRDRKTLSDPVRDDSQLHVMQALSGG
jgi:hypothetical protein